MTILAVDDEPLLRNLIATVLQDHGYAVLTAESGAQAINIFRSHPGEIDVLISDIVMPGMDGPTLAVELLRSQPDLKVLLMSGFCDAAQLSFGFEFIAKPFALSDLIEKVRELSPKRVHAQRRSTHGRHHEEAVLTATR
jgi:two-component system cell cycle sensor histidine kinase/response regulator CckA